MKKRLLSSIRAFTLVELVIVMGVIAIVTTVGLSSFVNTIRKNKEQTAMQKALQAKNAYSMRNEVDVSDFSQFYFIYNGITYKGTVTGDLVKFNNFGSVNTANLEKEVFNEVEIWHPAEMGYYSIETYLENGFETGEYGYPYNIIENLTGYVGSTTTTVVKKSDGTYDVSNREPIDGYVLAKVDECYITNDPDQNVVKIYYNCTRVDDSYMAYIYFQNDDGSYPNNPLYARRRLDGVVGYLTTYDPFEDAANDLTFTIRGGYDVNTREYDIDTALTRQTYISSRNDDSVYIYLKKRCNYVAHIYYETNTKNVYGNEPEIVNMSIGSYPEKYIEYRGHINERTSFVADEIVYKDDDKFILNELNQITVTVGGENILEIRYKKLCEYSVNVYLQDDDGTNTTPDNILLSEKVFFIGDTVNLVFDSIGYTSKVNGNNDNVILITDIDKYDFVAASSNISLNLRGEGGNVLNAYFKKRSSFTINVYEQRDDGEYNDPSTPTYTYNYYTHDNYYYAGEVITYNITATGYTITVGGNIVNDMTIANIGDYDFDKVTDYEHNMVDVYTLTLSGVKNNTENYDNHVINGDGTNVLNIYYLKRASFRLEIFMQQNDGSYTVSPTETKVYSTYKVDEDTFNYYAGDSVDYTIDCNTYIPAGYVREDFVYDYTDEYKDRIITNIFSLNGDSDQNFMRVYYKKLCYYTTKVYTQKNDGTYDCDTTVSEKIYPIGETIYYDGKTPDKFEFYVAQSTTNKTLVLNGDSTTNNMIIKYRKLCYYTTNVYLQDNDGSNTTPDKTTTSEMKYYIGNVVNYPNQTPVGYEFDSVNSTTNKEITLNGDSTLNVLNIYYKQYVDYILVVYLQEDNGSYSLNNATTSVVNSHIVAGNTIRYFAGDTGVYTGTTPDGYYFDKAENVFGEVIDDTEIFLWGGKTAGGYSETGGDNKLYIYYKKYCSYSIQILLQNDAGSYDSSTTTTENIYHIGDPITYSDPAPAGYDLDIPTSTTTITLNGNSSRNKLVIRYKKRVSLKVKIYKQNNTDTDKTSFTKTEFPFNTHKINGVDTNFYPDDVVTLATTPTGYRISTKYHLTQQTSNEEFSVENADKFVFYYTTPKSPQIRLYGDSSNEISIYYLKKCSYTLNIYVMDNSGEYDRESTETFTTHKVNDVDVNYYCGDIVGYTEKRTGYDIDEDLSTITLTTTLTLVGDSTNTINIYYKLRTRYRIDVYWPSTTGTYGNPNTTDGTAYAGKVIDYTTPTPDGYVLDEANSTPGLTMTLVGNATNAIIVKYKKIVTYSILTQVQQENGTYLTIDAATQSGLTGYAGDVLSYTSRSLAAYGYSNVDLIEYKQFPEKLTSGKTNALTACYKIPTSLTVVTETQQADGTIVTSDPVTMTEYTVGGNTIKCYIGDRTQYTVIAESGTELNNFEQIRLVADAASNLLTISFSRPCEYTVLTYIQADNSASYILQDELTKVHSSYAGTNVSLTPETRTGYVVNREAPYMTVNAITLNTNSTNNIVFYYKKIYNYTVETYLQDYDEDTHETSYPVTPSSTVGYTAYFGDTINYTNDNSSYAIDTSRSVTSITIDGNGNYTIRAYLKQKINYRVSIYIRSEDGKYYYQSNLNNYTVTGDYTLTGFGYIGDEINSTVYTAPAISGYDVAYNYTPYNFTPITLYPDASNILMIYYEKRVTYTVQTFLMNSNGYYGNGSGATTPYSTETKNGYLSQASDLSFVPDNLTVSGVNYVIERKDAVTLRSSGNTVPVYYNNIVNYTVNLYEQQNDGSFSETPDEIVNRTGVANHRPDYVPPEKTKAAGAAHDYSVDYNFLELDPNGTSVYTVRYYINASYTVKFYLQNSSNANNFDLVADPTVYGVDEEDLSGTGSVNTYTSFTPPEITGYKLYNFSQLKISGNESSNVLEVKYKKVCKYTINFYKEDSDGTINYYDVKTDIECMFGDEIRYEQGIEEEPGYVTIQDPNPLVITTNNASNVLNVTYKYIRYYTIEKRTQSPTDPTKYTSTYSEPIQCIISDETIDYQPTEDEMLLYYIESTPITISGDVEDEDNILVVILTNYAYYEEHYYIMDDDGTYFEGVAVKKDKYGDGVGFNDSTYLSYRYYGDDGNGNLTWIDATLYRPDYDIDYENENHVDSITLTQLGADANDKISIYFKKIVSSITVKIYNESSGSYPSSRYPSSTETIEYKNISLGTRYYAGELYDYTKVISGYEFDTRDDANGVPRDAYKSIILSGNSDNNIVLVYYRKLTSYIVRVYGQTSASEYGKTLNTYTSTVEYHISDTVRVSGTITSGKLYIKTYLGSTSELLHSIDVGSTYEFNYATDRGGNNLSSYSDSITLVESQSYNEIRVYCYLKLSYTVNIYKQNSSTGNTRTPVTSEVKWHIGNTVSYVVGSGTYTIKVGSSNDKSGTITSEYEFFKAENYNNASISESPSNTYSITLSATTGRNIINIYYKKLVSYTINIYVYNGSKYTLDSTYTSDVDLHIDDEVTFTKLVSTYTIKVNNVLVKTESLPSGYSTVDHVYNYNNQTLTNNKLTLTATSANNQINVYMTE